MRSVARLVLRLLALASLLALTVGVPVVVLVTVGVPWPTGAQWSEAWRTHRIDSDVAMRVGAAVFMVLWAWFTLTAVAECAALLRVRRDPTSMPELDRRAPSGWVRALVRIAMLSAVAASAVGAGGLPASAAPAGHVVVAGDCYWDIAGDHLASTLHREPTPREVAALTDELIDLNAPRLGHGDPTLIIPGEVVEFPDAPAPETPATVTPGPGPVDVPQPADEPVPAPTIGTVDAATSTSTSVSPATVAPSQGAPTAVPPASVPDEPHDGPVRSSSGSTAGVVEGLGAAALLAAGAMAVVRSRRRRRLTQAGVGARLAAPTLQQTRTELQLCAVSSAERVARLDVALRGVASDIAAQHATVTAAVVGEQGEIRLYLDGAAVPSSPPWRLDPHAGIWLLPGWVSLDELARTAVGRAQPCPAMVHLGPDDEGGDVFVDLEAVGVLGVDSPAGSAILRGIAAAVAVSPFRECGTLVLVGTALARAVAPLGMHHVTVAPTLAEALRDARAQLSGMRSTVGTTATFWLRTVAAGGESWEPTIVVADGAAAHDLDGGLAEVRPANGLGVVTDRPPAEVGCRLVHAGDHHVLEPYGLRVTPVAVESSEVHEVVDLVRAADEPLLAFDEPFPFDLTPHPFDPQAPARFEEPAWSLLVRLLGPMEVVDRELRPVVFERSKALELVAWLSQHRERPTRSSARAALWDVDVRDSTFANVVSDARRAMAKAVPPPHGEEWVGRTLTDDLPLHPLVLTDADLLLCRVAAAKGLAPADAVEVLRPGLELITGMPFAGSNSLWADAEGHASALVLLATNAAIELARHFLALDDVDGVFWATGQGLRVLAGHEELIALRMRAHARRGDLAGVRQEWEGYERALASDPWMPVEPSSKLVALRRELLHTPVGAPGT